MNLVKMKRTKALAAFFEEWRKEEKRNFEYAKDCFDPRKDLMPNNVITDFAVLKRLDNQVIFCDPVVVNVSRKNRTAINTFLGDEEEPE